MLALFWISLFRASEGSMALSYDVACARNVREPAKRNQVDKRASGQAYMLTIFFILYLVLNDLDIVHISSKGHCNLPERNPKTTRQSSYSSLHLFPATYTPSHSSNQPKIRTSTKGRRVMNPERHAERM